MTNPWTDIRNTDLVVIMGGNAAEAHPCGFKWVTEAKANRGAKLIVVDPRYTRSAAVSDYYAPIRQGSDIAFLLGVINYCMQNDKVQWEYLRAFTNASFIVKDGFEYRDGLFTGYDPEKREYDRELGLRHRRGRLCPDGRDADAPALRLESPEGACRHLHARDGGAHLRHPARQVPACGGDDGVVLDARPHHDVHVRAWLDAAFEGSQNIRCMAMLQLILGNIGVRGGGMNALRGHSNIQGLTDIGLLSNLIPGYLNIPTDKEPDFETYMASRGFQPLRPNQVSYWQNYRKFIVSFLKAMWGPAATAENQFAYDYLPKLDLPAYDVLRAFEMMSQGQMHGYFCQGFNPLLAFPNRGKITASLSKLKYLVIMDPLETETARFWENHGEYNDVDTASIQTEVYQLPTSCFAEDEGALVNSGRWLQWHWPAQNPPGDAKRDNWIMAQIHLHLKRLYQEEGGVFPTRS